MNALTHPIKFVVGDWSGDGHGLTKDVYVMMSHDEAQLRTWYSHQLAQWVSRQASDYGDSSIDISLVAALNNQGIETELDLDDRYINEPEEFVILLLDTIKLIAKQEGVEFAYEVFDPAGASVLRPGGYGLLTP